MTLSEYIASATDADIKAIGEELDPDWGGDGYTVDGHIFTTYLCIVYAADSNPWVKVELSDEWKLNITTLEATVDIARLISILKSKGVSLP